MARVEDKEMSWSCDDDDPPFSDRRRWIVSDESKNDQMPTHLDAFLFTF